MPTVFISYSRVDSARVDILEKKLRELGYTTWIDRDALEGGDDWAARIESAITRSDVVVLMLSPDAVASIWVRREIAFAQQAGKPIIPLLVRTTGLPLLIAEAQWLDFRDPNQDARTLPLLRQTLQQATRQPARFRSASVPGGSLPRRIAPTPQARADDPPAQVVALQEQRAIKPGRAIAGKRTSGFGRVTLTLVVLIALFASATLILFYSQNGWRLGSGSPSTHGANSPTARRLATATSVSTHPAQPTVTPTAPTYSTPGANSGRLFWRYGTAGAVNTTPIVINGIVYFGSWDFHVYAVRASSGGLIWQSPMIGAMREQSLTGRSGGGGDVAALAIANNVIYVSSGDGSLSALRIADGSLIWKYQTGGALRGAAAVANGAVYVGSEDHYFYALNANNGSLIWKHLTGNEIHSTPTVFNGLVYISSDDHYVSALRAADGSVAWEYKTGYAVDSSPILANGVIYVGSWDHYLYALNATSGSVIWKYHTGDIITGTVAVSNGVVYVASLDQNMYALRATNGALIWKRLIGFIFLGSLTVANGEIYFGAVDDNLYALRASDGSLIWKYKTGSVIIGAPTAVSGIVYVGSEDDYLYAIYA